jgi:hypothetical protein
VQIFAAASFVATLVAGLVVGGRLLALARATHRTAELFLGFGVVVLVAASILEIVALELARGSELAHLDLAYSLEVLGLLAHSASASSLCFATWRVFHPQNGWALRICLVATALLFTSWQAVILLGEHTSGTGFTPWFHLHVAARGGAFAWCAIEAARHHARLRKQLALGLVEPYLCHRFLLWAVGMGTTTAMLATALVTNVTRGVLVFAWPPALLLVSLLGLVGAASLWLAFLPPARYVRWVTTSAAKGSEPFSVGA